MGALAAPKASNVHGIRAPKWATREELIRANISVIEPFAFVMSHRVYLAIAFMAKVTAWPLKTYLLGNLRCRG
jgi:hypothetical protein